MYNLLTKSLDQGDQGTKVMSAIMMWNGDVTDGHDEDHNVYNLITKYLHQGDQGTGGGAEGESVSTCTDNRLCCVVIVMRMMVMNIVMVKLNTNLTFV